MAAATLVATAFGIIIIIVTAYVLAGGTLLTSEVVINAQKDMTDLQVKMLGTSITVQSNSTDGSYFYIQVLNDGREPIRDFEHIDVFIYASGGWSRYTYQNTTPPFANHWAQQGLISPHSVYPNQWDPGESLNMSVSYGSTPDYFKIVTANGVSNF
jgi:flagellar protein FlaF